ncbi:DUF4893 domain-containing protein [Sphingomonas xanthus]|uniref:DUF4893 domain-containing protein n=1 Tax=Sphingomonas xanthus TaxID=2594473 RepID=A0A516ISM9_9SPHN|nr:DUF4893 domain-containing protein [Sphingomonas xanthus]QDP19922.1 DUF4893 domain-containing protein [Sphingomonas xanthus]
MKILAPLLIVALAGCATTPAAPPTTDWRSVATSNDRERLRQWRDAFTDALAKARAAGHATEVAKEGALLVPDAAIGSGPIPSGDYRCRVIKVGAKTLGQLDYIAYPAFRCRIETAGALQRFTKLTGSQRHVGTIYPADQLRQLFLGTLVLGDETRALEYGVDRERDLAGWVERIGERRWRLLLPYPQFESTIDVIELVPEA